jgi:hypothetical protein
MTKKTYSGYPGVYPNPHNQEDSPEQGEVVKVLGTAGGGSLVVDVNDDVRLVPNEWVKPA